MTEKIRPTKPTPYCLDNIAGSQMLIEKFYSNLFQQVAFWPHMNDSPKIVNCKSSLCGTLNSGCYPIKGTHIFFDNMAKK